VSPTVRRVVSLAVIAAVPALAGAQVACKWSRNDAWVKRQAEFFDDSKREWTDDSLRTALLAAAGLQAPLDMPVSFGVDIEGRDRPLGPNAPEVIASLRPAASSRTSPWPTKSVVGAAGAHALYVIALHDSVLIRSIHRFMEAGPAEAPAIDVAMWEDRLRVQAGRKQIYGTQFRLEGGRVSLAAMEDSAHADLRREDAGLPPFALGLCMAKNAARRAQLPRGNAE